MRRRYDLERSDNIPYVGKKAYTCTGSGLITINTGFPVRAAAITWSSLPNYESPYEMSSSSSSNSSSSSIDSSSSSSSSTSNSSSSSSTSNSSSSESSGGYLNTYCFIDSGDATVDGEYTKNGMYWHEKPIYFNGTHYLYYQHLWSDGEYWGWVSHTSVIDDFVNVDAYNLIDSQFPQGDWEILLPPYGFFTVQEGPCTSSSTSSEEYSSSSSTSSNSSSSTSSTSSESIGNSSSSSSSYAPRFIVEWIGPVGSPDPTGIYYDNGTYNGCTAYSREDNAFWLYDDPGDSLWKISNGLGDYPGLWKGSYFVIDCAMDPDTFIPNMGASGSLIITVYPIDASTSSTSANYSSSSSTSNSSSSSSSSSTSNEYPGPFNVPRIYIWDYISNGFRVRYENIPEEIGFVEFAYIAF